MKSLELRCGNCAGTLAVTVGEQLSAINCPLCQAPAQIHAFPAFFRVKALQKPERVLLSDESSCFFHAQNKAAVACEQCGRFLCSLCDLEESGQHFCPACFASRQAPEQAARPLRISRYDHIALSMAILPLLVWPLTLFTAPATLYTVIRYWKRPCGIMRPHRKSGYVVAAVVAGIQLILWVGLLISLIGGFPEEYS